MITTKFMERRGGDSSTVWRQSGLLALGGVLILAVLLSVAAFLMLRGSLPENLETSYVSAGCFFAMLLLGLLRPKGEGKDCLWLTLLPPIYLLAVQALLSWFLLPDTWALWPAVRSAIAISLGYLCGSVIKLTKCGRNRKSQKRSKTRLYK